MTRTEMPPKHLIRIGISSCLLGHAVRYDGGHKKNTYITQGLTPYFEFVPFCPEVAIGMGVPRPPIRLVERAGEMHAIGIEDPSQDFTQALQGYAQAINASLDSLFGYILKKDSPSCGMADVHVFDNNGRPKTHGAGIFAATLMKQRPLLPIVEETRLHDAAARENFIARVLMYYRWQQLLADGLSVKRLMTFHTRHTVTVSAQDPAVYHALGRMLAGAGDDERLQPLADRYITRLMQVLKKWAPQTPPGGAEEQG